MKFQCPHCAAWLETGHHHSITAICPECSGQVQLPAPQDAVQHPATTRFKYPATSSHPEPSVKHNKTGTPIKQLSSKPDGNWPRYVFPSLIGIIIILAGLILFRSDNFTDSLSSRQSEKIRAIMRDMERISDIYKRQAAHAVSYHDHTLSGEERMAMTSLAELSFGYSKVIAPEADVPPVRKAIMDLDLPAGEEREMLLSAYNSFVDLSVARNFSGSNPPSIPKLIQFKDDYMAFKESMSNLDFIVK